MIIKSFLKGVKMEEPTYEWRLVRVKPIAELKMIKVESVYHSFGWFFTCFYYFYFRPDC